MNALTPLPPALPALICLPDAAANPTTDLSFLGSEEDSLIWGRLTPKARAEVGFWLEDIEKIEAAGTGTKGLAVGKIARRRGLTESAVRAKYDRWKKEGWQALINRSKFKPLRAVPEATVGYYQSLCHAHGRARVTATQAWRALLKQLEQWRKDGGLPSSEHAIPGYDTPPKSLSSTRLPAGWSRDQFLRRAPSRAERSLTAQGPKAYSAYVPSIHTTRVGILPGQLVFFDDEQQDIYVNFMGSNKTMVRPLAFHALDCGSGCNLLRNFKPMIALPDGSKRQLNQSDFYWFTLAFLTQVGWREDTGTMLVGELGTAAWAEKFREAMRGASGGKVSFDTSGRFGDPAFRGSLFEGKSCGNSRFKAPIESGFNLIRNYTSALPGQTGRNRDEAPEESYGMKRYNDWCLKLVRTLPMERAMQVRMGLLEWSQFVGIGHDIVEAINQRTGHELEGWAESGYSLTVIHVNGTDLRLTPQQLKEATPQQVAAFQALIGMGAGRIEAMSPREVWDAAPKGAFRRLRDWMVGAVMGVEHARRVKVTDKLTIEIDDQEIDPDTLRYIAQVQNENGLVHQLERGNVYLAWLNPYAPDKLQIGLATKGHEGQWLGTAPAIPKPRRTDHESLVRQYSAVRQATAGERYLIEQHVSSTLLARTADFRWNKTLADTGKPVTPGEKAAASREAELTEALSVPEREAPAKVQRKAGPGILPDPFG